MKQRKWKVTFEFNGNETKTIEVITKAQIQITPIRMARRQLEKMGYKVGNCVGLEEI